MKSIQELAQQQRKLIENTRYAMFAEVFEKHIEGKDLEYYHWVILNDYLDIDTIETPTDGGVKTTLVVDGVDLVTVYPPQTEMVRDGIEYKSNTSFKYQVHI